MKVSIIERAGAETEAVIYCEKATDDIKRLASMLDSRRIPVRNGEDILLIDPSDVLYFEYVDGGVYAYLIDKVYRAKISLCELASDVRFFRCSKTMAVNLYAVTALKSGDCGRIIATVQNGEKLIISRRYAQALRQILLSDYKEEPL